MISHLNKNDPPVWLINGEKDSPSTRGESLRAPKEFAQPEQKLNARKDVVVEGGTFRWEKGNGNYKPLPKYRPYTSGD